MARKTRPEVFKSNVNQEASGCHRWVASTNPGGYGQFWDGGKLWRAHRWAWAQANGPIPSGVHLDHTCRNRDCVNLEHLRAVTQKQNSENLGHDRANNTSGYRGVSRYRATNRWRATITHNGKWRQLGYFDTPEDANEAIVKARRELFTHSEMDK